MLVIILIAVAVLLLYKYYVSTYNFWESKGVPHEPGAFPFGSDFRITLMRKFDGDMQMKYYKKFSTSPYYGLYFMRMPLLTIRDPEIIEIILTKEFSHFRNREFLKSHDKDVLSQNLFNIEGEKWRTLRIKLSPTFTSGKLKMMFQHFTQCSEVLDTLLNERQGTTIDVREIVSRYTTDVICSCAFGVETNSIVDPDNEFRKIGAISLNIDILFIIKFLLILTFPEVNEFIRLNFFSKKIEVFLKKAIGDIIEYRETNNVKRNDFIDLLIELKNKGTIGDDMTDEIQQHISQPVEMTLEMMVAQAFVFFVAGFETSSSVQTFCLYEMALNPDIQERLQKEIDQVVEKHGAVTYQAIKEMTYLDQVIKETVRKYPTLPALSRVCTKPLTLPGGLRLEKEDVTIIPIWALHRDPQYFPDPMKYDPERFSVENKNSIKPYTYLPFGEGPRMCIGMRFGLVQTKMGIITILRKHSVEPTKETEMNLQFSHASPTVKTTKPIKLKLVSRNKVK